MSQWIALLRGINVGGRNIIPMQELTDLLEKLGCQNVKTYIQSGNVVFDFSGPDPISLPAKITGSIAEERGFEPGVLLFDSERLDRIVSQNPFTEDEIEPKTLHVYILDSAPAAPDMQALENVAATGERFRLTGDNFYLHAPNGIGRSKLAAKVEKAMGVAATARNWNTIIKIRNMVDATD